MMRSLRSATALVPAALLAATLTAVPAAASPIQTTTQTTTQTTAKTTGHSTGQSTGHSGKGVVRCEFTPTPENPAARPVRIPSAKAKARGTVDVWFLTNYGPFAVRMNRDNAPCGVHNFVHLVNSRFYDHTQCFRLTDTARLGVLQCGDIYRQEEGGPGYKFPDEVTGQETYPRGTVAYGNQGPGTNGSEFFVVHSFANIAPNYTVLGHVFFGMSTFDRIVAAGIADPDGDGPPTRPVRILKVWTAAHR